jgi:hypothetical protein
MDLAEPEQAPLDFELVRSGDLRQVATWIEINRRSGHVYCSFQPGLEHPFDVYIVHLF